MRNRTELVTTTVEGSDNEESGADDSGEDWQPEKVLFSLDFFFVEFFRRTWNASNFLLFFWNCLQTPGGGRKSAGRKSVTKTPAKRKSTTRASVSAKKSKKAAESNDSEPEEEEGSEDPDDSEDEENEDEDGADEDFAKRNRRQVSGKNHPDKDGFMEL